MSTETPETPGWLADAVIYEIYPQSFADSDGDGIGDLPGRDRPARPPAVARRQHDLVQPVLRLAVRRRRLRRLGLPADRAALRHQRRPGRVRSTRPARAGSGCCSTSSPGTPRSSTQWFQAELHAAGPRPEGDRYVWSTGRRAAHDSRGAPGDIAVGALARAAARLLPEELLRRAAGAELRLRRAARTTSRGGEPVDAPGPRRNRQALRDIMAFWLDRGVAGFRVDMAFSLVKDDPGFAETTDAVARAAATGSTATYPERGAHPGGREPHAESRPAVPRRLLPGDRPGARARCSTTAAPAGCRGGRRRRASSTPTARARPTSFLRGLGGRAARPDRAGPILLATADHDFSRLACGTRTRAARRGVRVPADLGDGAVDLLRRRDRHAVPARPARRRGQRDLPRATTTGPAAGRRCSGTTRPTPGSPTAPPRRSTCRSTPTRTGRRSPPSSTTPTRPCTSSAT